MRFIYVCIRFSLFCSKKRCCNVMLDIMEFGIFCFYFSHLYGICKISKLSRFFCITKILLQFFLIQHFTKILFLDIAESKYNHASYYLMLILLPYNVWPENLKKNSLCNQSDLAKESNVLFFYFWYSEFYVYNLMPNSDTAEYPLKS